MLDDIIMKRTVLLMNREFMEYMRECFPKLASQQKANVVRKMAAHARAKKSLLLMKQLKRSSSAASAAIIHNDAPPPPPPARPAAPLGAVVEVQAVVVHEVHDD